MATIGCCVRVLYCLGGNVDVVYDVNVVCVHARVGPDDYEGFRAFLVRHLVMLLANRHAYAAVEGAGLATDFVDEMREVVQLARDVMRIGETWTCQCFRWSLGALLMAIPLLAPSP
eukprot:353727-Chlamydomonas_euryale.AAC.2